MTGESESRRTRRVPGFLRTKRFVLWLALSALAVSMILFWRWPALAPRQSAAGRYWDVVLGGSGRALRTEDGRAYFVRWGRGAFYEWTPEEQVERARKHAVREYLDHWLLDGESGAPRLDSWDRMRLGALTGVDFARTDQTPAQWWRANRDRFFPTAAQVAGFLQERGKQALLQQKLWQNPGQYPQTEQYEALRRNQRIGPMFRAVYSRDMDDLAERLSKGTGRTLMFAFEIVYFPVLLLYFIYVLPRWSGRMAAKGVRGAYRVAALAFFVHLGLVGPYLFGYSPEWATTGPRQVAILYNGVITAAELPVFAVLSALPEGVQEMLLGLAEPWDCVFYPFLAPLNDFGTYTLSLEEVQGRTLVFLLGSLAYAFAGAFHGASADRARRRSGAAAVSLGTG